MRVTCKHPYLTVTVSLVKTQLWQVITVTQEEAKKMWSGSDNTFGIPGDIYLCMVHKRGIACNQKFSSISLTMTTSSLM